MAGRITALTILLTLTTVGLAVLLHYQWNGSQVGKAEFSERLLSNGGENSDTNRTNHAPYAALPKSAYREVLERPLFTEGRIPPVVEKAQIVPVQENLALKLEGVVFVSERHIAIVRDIKSNELLRLPAGGDYKGWQVAEVGKGEVVLRKGKRSINLILEAGTSMPVRASRISPKQLLKKQKMPILVPR
ncbi:MAG: hypothetical protein HPY30_15280 [Gammaproteobacteria bacterium (ex Lamellibrachia satsuma)]|nr:MAG: hypothetical protein HPY30_15280 [Gammaproteobacteria bacterium (ex Lamellibrachia satsuma)]